MPLGDISISPPSSPQDIRDGLRGGLGAADAELSAAGGRLAAVAGTAAVAVNPAGSAMAGLEVTWPSKRSRRSRWSMPSTDGQGVGQNAKKTPSVLPGVFALIHAGFSSVRSLLPTFPSPRHAGQTQSCQFPVYPLPPHSEQGVVLSVMFSPTPAGREVLLPLRHPARFSCGLPSASAMRRPISRPSPSSCPRQAGRWTQPPST